MPPAASEEANSDKMKLKRIRKERHARCFLKLLKEIAIKVKRLRKLRRFKMPARPS